MIQYRTWVWWLLFFLGQCTTEAICAGLFAFEEESAGFPRGGKGGLPTWPVPWAYSAAVWVILLNLGIGGYVIFLLHMHWEMRRTALRTGKFVTALSWAGIAFHDAKQGDLAEMVLWRWLQSEVDNIPSESAAAKSSLGESVHHLRPQESYQGWEEEAGKCGVLQCMGLETRHRIGSRAL